VLQDLCVFGAKNVFRNAKLSNLGDHNVALIAQPSETAMVHTEGQTDSHHGPLL